MNVIDGQEERSSSKVGAANCQGNLMTKAITLLMTKDERQCFLTMFLNHDDNEEKYDCDHYKSLVPDDDHLQEVCPSG